MKKRLRNTFIFTLICAALTMIFVLTKIYSTGKPLAIPQDAENLIEVPRLCQHPEFPSGCESTATVMVLRFYEEKVSLNDFVNKWLDYDDEFYTKDGKTYGPNPNEIFVGDPASEYAYGCYAPAIVKAVNENSKVCSAKEVRGSSLEELCQTYIENDQPVLIWATMNMQDSVEGNSWYFEDGTQFTWVSREHCMVLMGYDEDYYFFNDPETGNALAYHKSVVEEKFRELGSQAVLITPRTEN